MNWLDSNRFLLLSLAGGVLLTVVIAGVAWPSILGSSSGASDWDGEYATVTILDENGTELTSVRAMVADTPGARYTGLSDTESLPPDTGMLFVYEEEQNRTFVMRDMDFPIDMVFVGEDNSINAIYHAEQPPAGTPESDLKGYEASAQWVLELPYEYTIEHNIEEGDRIEIKFEEP